MPNRVRNSLSHFCYSVIGMTWGTKHTDELAYRSSARRDLRVWGMFIVGAVFMFAGLTVNPQDNCGANGECAPWLVPIAFVMGAAIGLSGLGMLMANPNRGSQIDPDTGDLVWWQGRVGKSGGDEGRIHPTQIGKLRIVRQDDSDDEVHLYDLEGNRLFWFDQEVIPWPYERWAERLAARWPHIEVDKVD